MPMTEKELLERDVKRNLGDELLQSVKEMRAEKVGHAHEVNIPEVIEARNKVFHIDSMGIEAGKHALKDPAIQSMLQQLKDPTSELSQKLKAVQAIDPMQLKAGKAILTKLGIQSTSDARNLFKNSAYQGAMDALKNTPHQRAMEQLTAAQALHNSPITRAYINSAETALKALGGHSALSDMMASIKPYQSEIDSLLSRGVDAQVARAMYGTHAEVLKQFRNLKPPKKQKKNKKYWKQKAKEIGKAKANELEQLKIQHEDERAKDKADNLKLEETNAQLSSQLETLKKIMGVAVVENSISVNDKNKILKKRNKELEPSTELPEPTTEENEFFNKLKERAQNQVNLISVVIKELGYLSVGNGEKAKIHTECHAKDPHLITASFGGFKTNPWRNAYKSGRTPK